MKKLKLHISRRFNPAAFVPSSISMITKIGFAMILLFSYSLTAAAQKSPQQLSENSKQISGKKNNPGVLPIDQMQVPLQNTVPGEYLVTVSEKTSADDLKRIFSKFSIVSITGLDNTPGVYLLKLKEDPGLEALQKTAKMNTEIIAIQPNFIYRAISPHRGGPQ